MVIFALFASGFNLLFGHVGELSFGHAMFFTIGAYATALYSKGYSVVLFGQTLQHGSGDNMLLALVLSLALGLLWALLLARIVVPRSSGIYFSMITLAFAQVIFFITFHWNELTGGEDGMQGIVRPAIAGLGDNWLRDSNHFFLFTAVVVFVALIGLYWIIASPFGSVLHAIRENKQRARFLGYDVDKFRVNAFVLSALFPADRRLAVDLLSAVDQSRRGFGRILRQRRDDVAARREPDLLGADPRRVGLLRAAEQRLAAHQILGSLDRGRVRRVRAGRAARDHGAVRRHPPLRIRQRREAWFLAHCRVQTDMSEELPPIVEDPVISETAG